MSLPERRIRLDLAYDGTDFSGWQVQPRVRTVQGVLESVLTTLQGEGAVGVRGAGRTDAGVHARGQVADAWARSRLDDDKLHVAANALLPRDMRVLGLRTVSERFHARHDARSKTYRFVLDRSPAGDPFRARFALHHPFEVDRARLHDALGRLPGRRDWTAFCATACEKEDRVRDLTEASYEEISHATAVFTFTADGFLMHMVRNLVGTLLEVARGRMAPERIDEILAARERTLAGPAAPAHGLCLERVVHAERPSAET